VQARVQKISLTLPGNLFTTALAPFTATDWQAPTAGILGAGPGAAALVLARSGTQTGRRRACAVGRPAAGGRGALAGRLGAALDVSAIPGAEAAVGGAAGRGAGCRRDANARKVVWPIAGLIDGRQGR
jgi:hypothetical protein